MAKGSIHWVSIMIKSFFCLSYHCCSDLMKWSNTQNQMLKWDWQCYATITLVKVRMPLVHKMMSTCQIKGGHKKYIGLLMHNMKPCIPHNGSKGIPNDIVKYNPFPSWEQWKRWVPFRSKSWINPRAKGWGMVNLMHNTKEKISKAKWKERVIALTKSHVLTYGAHWFVCAPLWFNLHYLPFFFTCAYWLYLELKLTSSS